MRGALIALAVAILSPAPAFAQETHDLSGAWRGRETPEPDGGAATRYPPRFTAALTQAGDVLHGEGRSNPCPACVADNQYAVRWQGRVEGDRVTLTMSYDPHWRDDVRFEGRLNADGQCITGLAWHGAFRTPFVMGRLDGARCEPLPPAAQQKHARKAHAAASVR